MKGLLKCHLAMEMKTALTSCDTLLLVGPTGKGRGAPINSVMLEMLARTAYSRERGFEDVHREEDWKRPKNATKEWISKVKFREINRWDPRYEATETFKIPYAEKEVRAEVEREALILKSAAKLEKNSKADVDPLNH